MTPMMERYAKAKQACGDGMLVLIRLGDFYEAFGEDARTIASVIGLTLTKRKDMNEGIEFSVMTGFPCYQLDRNLAALLASGHLVSVVDSSRR